MVTLGCRYANFVVVKTDLKFELCWPYTLDLADNCGRFVKITRRWDNWDTGLVSAAYHTDYTFSTETTQTRPGLS